MEGIDARLIVQGMRKKVRPDATLNFDFKGHVQGHKGHMGRYLNFCPISLIFGYVVLLNALSNVSMGVKSIRPRPWPPDAPQIWCTYTPIADIWRASGGQGRGQIDLTPIETLLRALKSTTYSKISKIGQKFRYLPMGPLGPPPAPQGTQPKCHYPLKWSPWSKEQVYQISCFYTKMHDSYSYPPD